MGQLKITPEHLETLANAIRPLDTEDARASYRAAGLSDKRYRWDLTYAAKLTPFICDTIYPYADDTHIDSALRTIVPPLNS